MSVNPVLTVIGQRIAARTRSLPGDDHGLVVAICGAPGSGKSTLAPLLECLLEAQGLATVTLALDDFYLPKSRREQLGSRVHPLFRTRGVPGTHDVGLALETLAALRGPGFGPAPGPGLALLPHFDKGTDDRSPAHACRSVRTRPRVILFEGWCMGATPEPEAMLAVPVNELERDEDAAGIWRRYVNRALAETYRPLFQQIDLLILLAAPDFGIVYRWRLQQERELRLRVAAQGGNLDAMMDDRQLRRFIQHYERLTTHILMEMPARADLVVRLDAERHMTLDP